MGKNLSKLILIVDDEVMIQRTLEGFLEKAGHKCLVASDAMEALLANTQERSSYRRFSSA